MFQGQYTGFNANYNNTGNTGTNALFDSVGTLWVWGANTVGQLGTGNKTSYSSPVQVGSLATWCAVAAGASHAVALRSDGSVWTWGSNQYGQLGQGNITNYSSPIQIGTSSYTWIACSDNSTFLIRNDGTLWGVGRNSMDQFGTTTASYSSPIQIGSATNWSYITSGGDAHFNGIQSTNTLWGCGQNNSGQLGLNNTTNPISTVTQVNSDITFVYASTGVDSTSIIKNDGSLWSFGDNTNGQLGNNSTTAYSSPVQVAGTPAGDTWLFVSQGHNENCSAIRNDNTLWSWGNGATGALGHNNTANCSSPVQIGTNSNWAYCNSSWSPSGYGITTNGALYAWGNNNVGQLGTGNKTTYSSPVQVGTSTNWLVVVSYSNFALAIRQT